MSQKSILTEIKDKLSNEEKQQIIDETEVFHKRQQIPDDPEELAKLPLLQLSDIDSKTESYPVETGDLAGVRSIYCPIETFGICYLDLYFNTTGGTTGFNSIHKSSLKCSWKNQ